MTLLWIDTCARWWLGIVRSSAPSLHSIRDDICASGDDKRTARGACVERASDADAAAAEPLEWEARTRRRLRLSSVAEGRGRRTSSGTQWTPRWTISATDHQHTDHGANWPEHSGVKGRMQSTVINEIHLPCWWYTSHILKRRSHYAWMRADACAVWTQRTRAYQRLLWMARVCIFVTCGICTFHTTD